MDVKIVLALVLFACVWLSNGCNRNNVNRCTDDSKCHIERTEHHGRGKRSGEKSEAQYSITLQNDPCVFDTYDADQDGAITMDELRAVLGSNDDVNALFDDLDIISDEGHTVIKQDEFLTMSPLIITECFESFK